MLYLVKGASMELSFNHYYIFYKTALTKNISKTAKELYLSQPAVSKSISRLEDHLNCLLFNRSTKGVTLTKQGELLYMATEKAFRAFAEGEDQIRQTLHTPLLELNIGCSTTLCKHILVPYLKEFTRLYPNIKISILSNPTMECISLLEEGKIDLGLIGTQIKQKHLQYYEISEIQDTFIASKNYLSQYPYSFTTTSDFSNITFMMLNQGNLTRKYVDDYLKQKGSPIQKIMEVTSMDLLIDFAKADLGIACIIKEFVSKELEEGSLIEIPMQFSIPKRKVGFVTKSNSETKQALALFMDFYAFYINKKS